MVVDCPLLTKGEGLLLFCSRCCLGLGFCFCFRFRFQLFRKRGLSGAHVAHGEAQLRKRLGDRSRGCAKQMSEGRHSRYCVAGKNPASILLVDFEQAQDTIDILSNRHILLIIDRVILAHVERPILNFSYAGKSTCPGRPVRQMLHTASGRRGPDNRLATRLKKVRRLRFDAQGPAAGVNLMAFGL